MRKEDTMRQEETEQLRIQLAECSRQLGISAQRVEVYSGECKTLQKALLRKRVALSEIQRKMEVLEAKHEDDTHVIFALKNELRELTDKYTVIRNENGELSAKKSSLVIELQQKNVHVAELESVLGAKEAELAGLRSQTENLQNQLQEALDRINVLLADAAAEQEEKTARINELESTLGEKEAELAELRAKDSSFAGGYYPFNWATWLIPGWRRYYGEHYREISARKEKLAKGLDDISWETMELISRRNFELLPAKPDADKFLYRYDALYTPWELEGMGHTQAKAEFLKRHAVLPGCYLETTVAEFYNGLVYLPGRIKERLRGGHIIDGGAYWGDSLLAFSEYEPEEIHCFEPDPDNFELLEQTASANRLFQQARLNRSGLSSTVGEEELYGCELPSCSSTSDEHLRDIGSLNKGHIKVVSIDSYAERERIRISMIKLDIEGAEFKAINGAKNTICRDRPILLISIYHTPRDFFDIKPLIESWNLGYRFMIRKTTYRDLIAEVMLIGYVD